MLIMLQRWNKEPCLTKKVQDSAGLQHGINFKCIQVSQLVWLTSGHLFVFSPLIRVDQLPEGPQ